MTSFFDASATEEALEESGTTAKSDRLMSGRTSPTDTGSLSGGEESFLEALGADFRTLACSLRVTAGGVANYVQQSAMNVAAEIARLEEAEEDRAHHHNNLQNEADTADDTPLRLPWEIRLGGGDEFVEDTALKERIMELSTDETNFLRPPVNENTAENIVFAFDEPRIQLIRRLLEMDENLARTHARLSGRSDVSENDFWKNYFDRCEEERQEHLKQYGDQESIQSPNSLVQAEESESDTILLNEDESSFVIASPPTSSNSAEVRSVDSLVFVNVVKHHRDE